MSGPGGTPPPRTVAVILHYAREEMTARCVAALERSETPVRILIVDNASPDGSGERVRARFPQHDFLATGINTGYAGGNNRGIAWALGAGAERVLVINDDAEVSPRCVGLLNAALDADPLAAAASPTMLHAEPQGVIWWGGGRFDRLRVMGIHEGAGTRWDAAAAPPSARAVTALCGCAILFRAESLRELGAFREDFQSYVEDLELSVRYTWAGRRLLYVPAASVVHHVPYPEPEASAWKIRLRDRNRRRVARLHLGAWARARFALWFWASRGVLLGRYAWRRDWARVRALLRGAVEA